MKNLAIQNPDSSLSQVENKGPELDQIQLYTETSNKLARNQCSVGVLKKMCLHGLLSSLSLSVFRRWYRNDLEISSRLVRHLTGPIRNDCWAGNGP